MSEGGCVIVRLDTMLKKIGSVVVFLVGGTTGSENRMDGKCVEELHFRRFISPVLCVRPVYFINAC
jgi:hypothetical protein